MKRRHQEELKEEEAEEEEGTKVRDELRIIFCL
jgi:hypothetical protein